MINDGSGRLNGYSLGRDVGDTVIGTTLQGGTFLIIIMSSICIQYHLGSKRDAFAL